MRDIPNPPPEDLTSDVNTAEDLHRQLTAAVQEAQTTGDFTKADELRKQLEIKLAPLKQETERRGRRWIFSETFEGQVNILNIYETLRSSEQFFQEHNLIDLKNHLPQDIQFSAEGNSRIREALKMGFDRAMILPASEIQGRSLEAIIQETATKPHPGLSDPDQYTNPFVDKSTKQAQTRNRPPKAYLLMYQSQEVPPETKGKSADELEVLFQQKKWNGLTVSEYLLLQRKELETRQNHSFDAHDDDASKSQWTWLMDSRGTSSEVAKAYWGPKNRRVGVRWNDSSGLYPGLGARPAVVVEIL